MKRVLFGVVAVAALAFGGMFASKAEAHGPYRHHHCHPPVVCGSGYGVYSGYAPYGAYRQVVVPYGVGYSGGWQPYGNSLYIQQPRFGLRVGF